MPAVPRAIIWALPNQLPLIHDAMQAAHLEVIAVGSSSSEGAADLSKSLNVEREADLRQALRRDDVDVIWLADPSPIDGDARRLIHERRLTVVSCQPQFGTIAELLAELKPGPGARVVPMMRHSPGFRAAVDVLNQFGEVKCVSTTMCCGAGQSTLFARLYDAMDVIQSLCGEVESVNAALAGPLSETPEHAWDLTGHLTINCRCKSNRCAAAVLSDRTGAWSSDITLPGDGACLRITSGGFEWIGADGKLVDRHSEGGNLTPGQLIGMQIARLMDDRDAVVTPPDNVALLALCEAARLSCLTRQDESPEKLVEMMSRV